MPRPAKGPRLYLRPARTTRSGSFIAETWVIRDGAFEVSTGCGRDRLHGPDGAESKLAAYIADKWAPKRGDSPSDPSSVLIAEVLALYLKERAPALADPKATATRVKTLMGFWGEQSLNFVKRSTCQAYVAWRTSQSLKQAKYDIALEKRVTPQAARRELEDLSAAISHWHGEYPLSVKPKVWLPDKPESPRDALTRDQAARLLKASLGWRLEDGRWKRLSKSARSNRAHMRRFILIGLYTGTRPGVIPKLLWSESPTQAWVDVEAGVIYRRGKKEKDHRTKRRPLVRLPDRLTAHLKRWKAADEKRGITSVLHHGGEAVAGRIRHLADGARSAGLGRGGVHGNDSGDAGEVLRPPSGESPG